MKKEIEKILYDFEDKLHFPQKTDYKDRIKYANKLISLFENKIDECEKEIPGKFGLSYWYWNEDKRRLLNQIINYIKSKLREEL